MRRGSVPHVLDRRLTDALQQYRLVRDQLRVERGRRKQRELCDELDRLWKTLTAGERRELVAEFIEHERATNGRRPRAR